MRSTQQFSITLPHEMANFVKAKVASGAYASVSQVMREALRILIVRDASKHKWRLFRFAHR
jgi:putative addiction module CopG family antidote